MQNPYQSPGTPSPYGAQAPLIPQGSGLGTASFIISMFCIVTTIGGIFLMVAKIREAAETGSFEIYRSLAMIGIGTIGIMFLALVGLILGIVALTQPHQKRIMATLGTIFNALVILGFIVLMIMGQMRQ